MEENLQYIEKEGICLNAIRTQYLSVGVDIGADFSVMSTVLPTGELVGRPYKILHSNPSSVQGAIDRIAELSRKFELPARVFMEATGIYHYPIYYRMRDAGLDAFIRNPLITHAGKDMNVRNIYNDKFDAQKIAILGLRSDLKTSIVPNDEVATVKALVREYHAMKKESSMYICRLKNQLRQIFPQFIPIFSKVNGKASMMILERYTTPTALLQAGENELTTLITATAGRGESKAREHAVRLIAAAQEALTFGHGNSGMCFLIRHYVEMIRLLEAKTEKLIKQVHLCLKDHPSSLLTKQAALLQTIPGVGFLTAVTLVCEIGDFKAFRLPKQLYAYFGLDPIVRQSGNFTGVNLRMSKRGSPFARRSLYVLALQSVSLRKNGEPKNPVLRSFYLEKCKTKTKMTVLGAVMHKLCNIVFAVLRDEKPFELRSPQEHREQFRSAISNVA